MRDAIPSVHSGLCLRLALFEPLKLNAGDFSGSSASSRFIHNMAQHAEPGYPSMVPMAAPSTVLNGVVSLSEDKAIRRRPSDRQANAEV